VAVLIKLFITFAIKELGLPLIFGGDSPPNTFLRGPGLIDTCIKLMGSVTGVVVGLLHYSLGLTVLVLFSMILNIPTSPEDAAQMQGASHWRVFFRVFIPLL
jgi:putative spermidine/putrescine transport system permease protein